MTSLKTHTHDIHANAAFFFSVTCLLGMLATACPIPGWDTDLEAFVDTGLSVAYLKSVSHAQEGNESDADVRSGEPVTVTVLLNNPKELALAYNIGHADSMVSGTVSAPMDSTAASGGITAAIFTFTPSEAAEHADVEFELALRAPALNKNFAPAVFTVHCDSPPDPVNNLTAGIRANDKVCIGFTLDEDYADSDISAVEISYTSLSAGTSKTVTESVSRSGAGLTAVPSPALLNSNDGAYVRYFGPDDVLPGNQYTFTVTPIDASGKKCRTSASASVSGNELYLGYDPNGGTGSIAAIYGYNLITGTTIADISSISRPGYGFTGWNTKADGSGTAYSPGAGFTFGFSSLMLYAQWHQYSSVGASITVPGYQGVSVTRDGTTSTSITMDKDGTLPLSMSIPSGATNYQWYLNGTAKAAASSFSFTPTANSVTAGTCTITATAEHGGVLYSGSMTVTVTDSYMVTMLPYGKSATYDQTSWTYVNDSTVPSSFRHAIGRPFSMAKYEVSYGLWTTVRSWAADNGYTMANAGQDGYPAGSDITMPVTAIAYYDAVVWCNAYSEMMGYGPCYYTSAWDRSTSAVLRSTSVLRDLANGAGRYTSEYVLWSADGFRLPSEGEWHYAASCGGYYAYNHVSGNAASAYSWSNPDTYLAYANAVNVGTIPVRSLLPNMWGMYGMSGNAAEYCFDQYNQAPDTDKTDYVCDIPGISGGKIVICGGSFDTDAGSTTVGNRYAVPIDTLAYGNGFRLARTITQ